MVQNHKCTVGFGALGILRFMVHELCFMVHAYGSCFHWTFIVHISLGSNSWSSVHWNVDHGSWTIFRFMFRCSCFMIINEPWTLNEPWRTCESELYNINHNHDQALQQQHLLAPSHAILQSAHSIVGPGQRQQGGRLPRRPYRSPGRASAAADGGDRTSPRKINLFKSVDQTAVVLDQTRS